MPICYDEAGSLVLSDSMVDYAADVGDLFAQHAQELLALEGSHLREVLLIWGKDDGWGVGSVGWLYDEPIVLRFDEVDLVVSSSYRCCQPALSLAFESVNLSSPIRMVSSDWDHSERINGLYDLEWRAYDPMQHLFGLRAHGFCLASDEGKHATSVRFWLEGEIPIRVGEAFDETRIDVLNEIDAEYAEEYELYDALLLPARRDDRGVPYPACPRCGSRDVARIVGGRPVNFTREQDKYARGLLRLGSCMISFDSPRWHCNACHKPFGRIPLPLSLYPRFNRTPSVAEEAWPHTQGNRSEVESSMYCGCYGCLQIVTRFEIRDWLSDSYGYGETALCPKCGLDAIIGDASGFPINRELLAGMHSHWLE